jgi:hypothetical protein
MRALLSNWSLVLTLQYIELKFDSASPVLEETGGQPSFGAIGRHAGIRGG